MVIFFRVQAGLLIERLIGFIVDFNLIKTETPKPRSQRVYY